MLLEVVKRRTALCDDQADLPRNERRGTRERPSSFVLVGTGFGLGLPLPFRSWLAFALIFFLCFIFALRFRICFHVGFRRVRGWSTTSPLKLTITLPLLHPEIQ